MQAVCPLSDAVNDVLDTELIVLQKLFDDCIHESLRRVSALFQLKVGRHTDSQLIGKFSQEVIAISELVERLA